MLQTSKDILFLTLALSSALITIFICWSLYYLLISIRDIRVVIKKARKKVDQLFTLIDRMKDKTEATATAATAISKAAIEVVDYVKEKKLKKEKKS